MFLDPITDCDWTGEMVQLKLTSLQRDLIIPMQPTHRLEGNSGKGSVMSRRLSPEVLGFNWLPGDKDYKRDSVRLTTKPLKFLDGRVIP